MTDDALRDAAWLELYQDLCAMHLERDILVSQGEDTYNLDLDIRECENTMAALARRDYDNTSDGSI